MLHNCWHTCAWICLLELAEILLSFEEGQGETQIIWKGNLGWAPNRGGYQHEKEDLVAALVRYTLLCEQHLRETRLLLSSLSGRKSQGTIIREPVWVSGVDKLLHLDLDWGLELDSATKSTQWHWPSHYLLTAPTYLRGLLQRQNRMGKVGRTTCVPFNFFAMFIICYNESGLSPLNLRRKAYLLPPHKQQEFFNYRGDCK